MTIVFYWKLVCCHIKSDLKKEMLSEGLNNTSGCGNGEETGWAMAISKKYKWCLIKLTFSFHLWLVAPSQKRLWKVPKGRGKWQSGVSIYWRRGQGQLWKREWIVLDGMKTTTYLVCETCFSFMNQFYSYSSKNKRLRHSCT